MSNVPPSEYERTYGGPPPAAGWRDPAVPPGRADYPPPAPPAGSPPPPGAWTQPPPGYVDPAYRDPAYQPTTAWGRGPGPAAGYRPPRARRAGPGLATVAPALLASLIISIGVLALFLGNLFIGVGASHGTPGRQRFLQFLSPADMATAAAVVLAVALVVLQRHGPVEAPVVGARGGRVRSIALLAGAVAAFVAVAAVVRAIVYMSTASQPAAQKIGFLIVQLAVAAVASAAAWWGLRTRW